MKPAVLRQPPIEGVPTDGWSRMTEILYDDGANPVGMSLVWRTPMRFGDGEDGERVHGLWMSERWPT